MSQHNDYQAKRQLPNDKTKKTPPPAKPVPHRVAPPTPKTATPKTTTPPVAKPTTPPSRVTSPQKAAATPPRTTTPPSRTATPPSRTATPPSRTATPKTATPPSRTATPPSRTTTTSTTPPKTTSKTTHIREESSNPITTYVRWRKEYYAGLTTGEKIRHRLLQFMVFLSVVVISVATAMEFWVKLPDVPTTPAIVSPSVTGNQLPTETVNPDTGEFILDGAVYPSVTQSGRKDGVYTFLVIGQDSVGGGTDTMILVSYDTINKTIDGMSLLRDTMVNVNANVPKLNAIYSYYKGSDPATQNKNGTDAMKLHISRLTGIAPDFYIMIEWEAVGELVDAIGGVEFDVPYTMKYDDPYQNLHIDQAAGLRLLDGDDAMEVIRHRQNNSGTSVGDVGRVAVQQDFLIAVARTCLTPEMLLKAPTLAEIFFSKVTTDLTVGNLLAFAQLAMGIDLQNDINMVSMPYRDMNRWSGISYVGVNQTEMLAIVNDGFNPYLSAITASDLQLMYSNSDGSFGVTNAALANSKMGYAYNNSSYNNSSSSSSSKDEEEEDDLPGQPDPDLPDPDSTGSTGSGSTGGTGSTGSGSTGSTDSSIPGSTDGSGSTGSGSGDGSGSTGSGSTDGSGSTGSGSTDGSGSTGSGSTDGSGSTGSDVIVPPAPDDSASIPGAVG